MMVKFDDLTLARTMNLTEAISVCIVSPIAHLACDLIAGHCKVNVLLHTPYSSAANRPDDSTPATDSAVHFNIAGVGDDTSG